MTEDFNLENQKKIYDLLEKNPGLHLNKIAELLGMNIPEVQRHLQCLEEQQLIIVSTDIGYKRYYVKSWDFKKRRQRTLETRRRIYDLINQMPGIYTSKIAEIMGMSTQLTDYHLLYLERKKKIFAIKESGGYYKKYYTVERKLGSQETKILDILSKRIPFEILLLLLKYHSLQHNEISKKMSISPSKLSYHLAKLMDHDLVDVQPHGSEKGYTVKNREEIIKILRGYQQRITFGLAVDEFKDVWDDFKYG